MSLQIVIPVIAALAGAGVAAFSGELRHFVELRRHRRKSLNRMLWCQLDLWYEVKRADLGDGIDLVFTKFAARVGVPVGSILPPEARNKLAGILAENVLSKRDPTLDLKYAVAVEDLASYEPLLAYQLSGKTDLQKHREQSDAYVSAIGSQFGTNSEADLAELAALSPFARAEIHKSAVQVIQEDIEDVAELLGRRTQKAVKKVLIRLEDRLAEDQSERVDAAVERVFTWWQSLVAAHQLEIQGELEPGAG